MALQKFEVVTSRCIYKYIHYTALGNGMFKVEIQSRASTDLACFSPLHQGFFFVFPFASLKPFFTSCGHNVNNVFLGNMW